MWYFVKLFVRACVFFGFFFKLNYILYVFSVGRLSLMCCLWFVRLLFSLMYLSVVRSCVLLLRIVCVLLYDLVLLVCVKFIWCVLLLCVLCSSCYYYVVCLCVCFVFVVII